MLGVGTLISPSRSAFALRCEAPRASLRVGATAAGAAVDVKSLYEVLRVKRDASPMEIKTAYRTLAKIYHPDATARFMDSSVASSASADGQDFIEINDAYSTLSDPDARAVYDFTLALSSRRRRDVAVLSRFQRWETDQCW